MASPLALWEYKTVLGGHSNRGGVKRQLHLVNEIEHGRGEILETMDTLV